MAENRGGMETVFHDVRPVELKLWLAINNRLPSALQRRRRNRPADLEQGGRGGGGLLPGRPLHAACPPTTCCTSSKSCRRGDMLPAIYFIFSRRGCREALQRCAYHELDLTTAAEKEAIDRVAAERLQGLKDHDEEALFRRMVDARLLRRGLAEHHAGLLPYHKEMVEELFQRGLIKVVFATETLSLGINMPARGVVVSSFTKFDGVNFSNLTTGELTQLMGRAGRRGIDVIGHGVILKESDVEVGDDLRGRDGPDAGRRVQVPARATTWPSTCSASTRRQQAEALMQRSFGQFQKRLAEEQDQRAPGQRPRAARGHPAGCGMTAEVSIDDVAQYFKLEDRRRAIRIELKRLRREAGARAARDGGGRHTRALAASTGPHRARLEVEAKGLLDRQRKLKVGPLAAIWRATSRSTARSARLQKELEGGEREVTGQMDEYARKLRRLCRILTETGFLAARQADRQGPLRVARSTARTRSWSPRRCGWAGWRDWRPRSCARCSSCWRPRTASEAANRQARGPAPLSDPGDRADRAAGPLAVLPLRRHGARPRRAKPAAPRRTTTSTSRTGGPPGEPLDQIPLPRQRRHRRRDQGDEEPLLAAPPARVGAPPGQIAAIRDRLQRWLSGARRHQADV